MDSLRQANLLGGPVNLAGGFVILALLFWINRTIQKPSSKVPGPWYTNWTNIVLQYHWMKGQRAYYVDDLHKKYGPVVRIAPDYIDFANIAGAKTIYGARETYRKSEWYTTITGLKTTSVFSTTDIDRHRKLRRLLAGPMAESSLKTVMSTVTSHVELFIQRMQGEMKSRGAVDVAKWAIFFSTDVIGELTFGESFKMLEKGEKNEYARQLENIAPMAALRSTFPNLVYLSNFIPLPIVGRAREATKKVRKYATESLDRYKRLLVEDPDRVQQTLFTKLFKAKDADALDYDDMVVSAQSYIIAGSDTTANTLTYLIWSVSRRPDIKARLLEELQKLPGDFKEADLRNLPYLTHVIDESLRLYSAAPSGLPRVVPKGGAEISGYWLDENTTVCSQAFSMHRNSDVFPQPEEFNPSRWETTTKEMKDSFMPFGGGARICIGLHLAQIELRLAAARFFLEFPNSKVSTLEGMLDDDMHPLVYFLLVPKGKRCLIEAC